MAGHAFDPGLFDRFDTSPDSLFYQFPRKVVHIDDGAITSVTNLYRELLPPGGAILDLMSSWRSHLPPEVKYARVTGLGMNTEEMRDNPQLTDFIVHSLNDEPRLPYAEGEFDAAACCVSVQYLQKPFEVFAEVRRVLKPAAPFIVTFSNRCFPTKAVNLWQQTDDAGHVQVVSLYFELSDGWRDITAQDRFQLILRLLPIVRYLGQRFHERSHQLDLAACPWFGGFHFIDHAANLCLADWRSICAALVSCWFLPALCAWKILASSSAPMAT